MDMMTVGDIAGELGLSQFAIQEVQRIGRMDSRKPRLLCVTCADKSTKFDFLRKSRDLRYSQKYKKCFINPDMTFSQREKNWKLRSELKEKRDQGLDVIIRNGNVVLRQDVTSSERKQNFPDGF